MNVLTNLKIKTDNLITVSKLKRNLLHSIYNMSDNFLKPIIDIDKKGSLRQRSPIYYHRVGYLYIIKSELIKKRILFGSKVIGVEVDSFYSFDIDENFDFKLQELLIKNKNLFMKKETLLITETDNFDPNALNKLKKSLMYF